MRELRLAASVPSFWLLSALLLATAAGAAPATATGASDSPLAITVRPGPDADSLFVEAMNRGGTNVVLVRPRAQTLDRFASWGGWSLDVRGTVGVALPPTYPGAVRPLQMRDLVELEPGESVGVMIRLDRYVVDRKAALAETPGTYTVVVRYHLEQDRVLGETSADVVAVPRLPPVESAPVRFTVAPARPHAPSR